MITRALLRIKAAQILYSCYQSSNINLKHVENELTFSINKTYELYLYLLLLPTELTAFAERRIDSARHKLRPTEADLNPNCKFIDNAFVAQLAQNSALLEEAKTRKLSWAAYQDPMKALFERLENSDYYQEYMAEEVSDYEADKELWRKFFKNELLDNEAFEDLLEDMSIYWLDDLDVVASFVQKTIKRFAQTQGAEQPLLPMYKDEKDRIFIVKLVHDTILNDEEYTSIIENYTKNWDVDRVALFDTLILKMALAELLNCPTIPVSVTLNEYIEIAKFYSTPRSHVFINGILDKIVADLRLRNALQKVGEIGNNPK